MDYADNWQVKYVDEIGSVYNGTVQITIYPPVQHYRDVDGDIDVSEFHRLVACDGQLGAFNICFP